MGYHVDRVPRPYDLRALIEVYILAQRKDFVHPDFAAYYTGLLAALEGLFGVRLRREGLSFRQASLWGLFENTVRSLLRIGSPWSGYLEASLLQRHLDESGEAGEVVSQASRIIHDANTASEAAHRSMLHALFVAIFGECPQVVTSEDLARAGFDDTKEPEISNYYDYF